MYRTLNSYLKEKFGCKVYKLAISSNMTCPNRDGTKDTRGCIFCLNGSGYFSEKSGTSITQQIENAKQRVSAKLSDGKYIAYFQEYSNTYAPVSILRDIFYEAINHKDIVALSIATRPDCLPDDVIMLLSELNKIKPVWVELGLQTIHDKTAEYIRRCYPLSDYDNAVKRLKANGIEVISHMIIGLPGESKEDMIKTAKYISDSGADGIKLQLLHVLRGTDLEKDYNSGYFDVLSLEQYTEILAECISVLRPDIVIHRITGDGAKADLVAPLWSGDKKKVLAALNKRLK